MLDEFREQASASPFLDEELEETDKKAAAVRVPAQRFLGMTPGQRFIISFMLLMMSCLLSAMFLLVTGKVVPPLF